MALWVLMGVAALVFTILAGVMQGRGARRAQQRVLARTSASASAVLHLLPLHGYRRVRSSLLGRVLHHCGLFIGFLAIAYAVTILLRFLWRAMILWL